MPQVRDRTGQFVHCSNNHLIYHNYTVKLCGCVVEKSYVKSLPEMGPASCWQVKATGLQSQQTAKPTAILRGLRSFCKGVVKSRD